MSCLGVNGQRRGALGASERRSATANGFCMLEEFRWSAVAWLSGRAACT